ncbi:hypothetical protein EDB81DRAFT_796484 [Dactylonectria macrodidyma]|uniref:Uncharacterized protein n=1 Tax=Dactylonectria macrodidyma TaxID=307937 RepID=A0A9P9ERX0_9HYPO|nr:hypothetical protein EDB81DRAFT_796484 [Dactylonectria macrodidyma]
MPWCVCCSVALSLSITRRLWTLGKMELLQCAFFFLFVVTQCCELYGSTVPQSDVHNVPWLMEGWISTGMDGSTGVVVSLVRKP